MWVIYEKKPVVRGLRKIPHEILVRYEAWKRIVEIQGPQGLRAIKGFHDEALKGSWRGYRFSRLGYKWRVIYTIENKVFEVFVIEITPHHY